jgi:hypothetical protein
VAAALTESNVRLAKQLEERSTELKEIRALLKKECMGHRSVTPSLEKYYLSRGYKVAKSHTSQSYNYPIDGHNLEATKGNTMGDFQANKECLVGATSNIISKCLKTGVPHPF